MTGRSLRESGRGGLFEPDGPRPRQSSTARVVVRCLRDVTSDEAPKPQVRDRWFWVTGMFAILDFFIFTDYGIYSTVSRYPCGPARIGSGVRWRSSRQRTRRSSRRYRQRARSETIALIRIGNAHNQDTQPILDCHVRTARQRRDRSLSHHPGTGQQSASNRATDRLCAPSCG